MHEVSLGLTLRDYLTGEQIEQTTYEDLRQALARMLVEEHGYPQEQLIPRVNVHYAAPAANGSAHEDKADQAADDTTAHKQPDKAWQQGGTSQQETDQPDELCRSIDIVVHDTHMRPLLLVLFCPGQVNTYRRETIAAARLISGGPAPLVIITDTREAMLVATATDTVLGEGMRAIPRYEQMLELAQTHPAPPLSEQHQEKERRILHTYSAFIKTCCDESMCDL